MPLDIDELKKKIIYRSNYRGTKEMDILLSSFVKAIIDQLNNKELEDLFDLINIDDDNLYKFKQGKKIQIQVKDIRITEKFKEFKI